MVSEPASGTTYELVCIPDAIPREDRAAHFALARELFQRLATAQDDLADGFCVQFAPAVFDQLARFVSNERRCCPAIRFVIDISPGDGPIALRMTGPAGAREFLKAELPLK